MLSRHDQHLELTEKVIMESNNTSCAMKCNILLGTPPFPFLPFAGYHRHSRREAGPSSEADSGGHDRQVQVAAASEQELTVDVLLRERERALGSLTHHHEMW